MKKYIYCALLALVAISCDKDSWDDSYDIPIVIPKSFYAQTPVLDFSTRSVSECQTESWDDSVTVNTRTYAVVDPANASEYYQYWNESDAISLFLTTKNLKYQMTSHIVGAEDVGKFELAEAASSGKKLKTDYFYSIYPYKSGTTISQKGTVTYIFPETQHYSGDSYANGENGMLATIRQEEWDEEGDNVLYFKNFCSYLQLRLTSSKGNVVKKITLKSNDDVVIAGEGTIDFDEDNEVPYVEMDEDGSNSITLECGEGVSINNTPTTFWFVLPAIDNEEFVGHQFLNGFEITVVFAGGPNYKKNTTKTINIERNHIKPMAVLETDILQNQEATIIYRYKDPLKNTTALPFINNETDKNFTDSSGNLLAYEQKYVEETQEWHVYFSDGDLNHIGNNVFDFGKTDDLDYIIVNNVPEINIGDHAFYNCTAESIEFYNAVNVIEHNAFGASDIKDVQINGNVTEIAANAFLGSSVKTLYIKGNVETIGSSAFLSSNIENLNIDGSVSTIGSSAFLQCDKLTSVTLNGVKAIDEYAFKYCENLSSITITTDNNTVFSLGEVIFADCVSLSTVILGAQIPPIFIHDNSESDGPYIFPSQTKIYVPSLVNYKNEGYVYPDDYKYPVGVIIPRNEWPKYYGTQLYTIESN